ncbi:MAG: flavodoxin/nitric oxide synthase [Bacillus sp. (in: firmicutes)]|nr:flavodoxin/nitric oxide synthase [Bacillus sp. (in: firmicutes)]
MNKELSVAIVYDSIFGNTKAIAERISQELRKNCEVIIGSIHNEIDPAQIIDKDLLIIGSPTHGHRPTHEMDIFLNKLRKSEFPLIHIAIFDTRYFMPMWLSGSAAKRMTKRLNKLGFHSICKPESFFVSKWEGPLGPTELDHAEKWAIKIRELLQQI